MQTIKYVFQPHGDDRGQLIAFEESKDIPFHIKRVYYMYNTAEGVIRGKHAHRTLDQILVCIHGSCTIVMDNGKEKKEIPLELPYEGLWMPHGVWHDMKDFAPGTVLLVFASDFYDPADYVRDYDEFLRLVEEGVFNEN